MQFQGLGHQVLRLPSQKELHEIERGERIRPGCRVRHVLGERHQSSRLLPRFAEISEVEGDPCEGDMDPAPQLGVVPHLPQGLFGRTTERT